MAGRGGVCVCTWHRGGVVGEDMGHIDQKKRRGCDTMSPFFAGLPMRFAVPSELYL